MGASRVPCPHVCGGGPWPRWLDQKEGSDHVKHVCLCLCPSPQGLLRSQMVPLVHVDQWALDQAAESPGFHSQKHNRVSSLASRVPAGGLCKATRSATTQQPAAPWGAIVHSLAGACQPSAVVHQTPAGSASANRHAAAINKAQAMASWRPGHNLKRKRLQGGNMYMPMQVHEDSHGTCIPNRNAKSRNTGGEPSP